jgi:hypothetical protein
MHVRGETSRRWCRFDTQLDLLLHSSFSFSFSVLCPFGLVASWKTCFETIGHGFCPTLFTDYKHSPPSFLRIDLAVTFCIPILRTILSSHFFRRFRSVLDSSAPDTSHTHPRSQIIITPLASLTNDVHTDIATVARVAKAMGSDVIAYTVSQTNSPSPILYLHTHII